MTQTREATATQTGTLTKVCYVTRKVQADLFALVETYGQLTEDYACKLIHDLRLMLDEEVLDRIEFLWTRPGTNQVVGAYSYQVIANGIGLADDRSGGIRYDPTLQSSTFEVRVSYNTRWKDELGNAGREAIRDKCVLRWGPVGQLDYGGGTWNSERMYSKDGYGLDRRRFVE